MPTLAGKTAFPKKRDTPQEELWPFREAEGVKHQRSVASTRAWSVPSPASFIPSTGFVLRIVLLLLDTTLLHPVHTFRERPSVPSTDDGKGTERDQNPALTGRLSIVARGADGTRASPWAHGNAIQEVRATKRTKES